MPGQLGWKRGSCVRSFGKCLLALAAPFLFGASAAANQWKWEEAVREAVNWHPSIVESADELRARAEQITIAKAGYHPQISAGFGSTYDNLSRSRWRPRANLSVSQMLFDFGKVSGSVAAARAGTRVGQAEMLLAIDTLIRDTSRAVIEIQRDAALRQVALDQLASIRGINELVDHRYRGGASTRSDALQAKARVEAAEVTLQEIEAEQRRWSGNLAFLTGRTDAPGIAVGAPRQLEGACTGGEPDWTRVPAVLRARAQRDEALADLARARAEGLPTISLSAGGGADVHDPFSRRADYNVGINVTSALYSGGARGARTRGAAHALRAAEAAEAGVRNEVNRQLVEAREQVDALERVLETLAARQASMAETGRLYRLQYLDMGTRTLVDLLNAEQELHQIRFDLVNSRYDKWRLESECLFYTGVQRDIFGLSGATVRGVTL